MLTSKTYTKLTVSSPSSHWDPFLSRSRSCMHTRVALRATWTRTVRGNARVGPNVHLIRSKLHWTLRPPVCRVMRVLRWMKQRVHLVSLWLRSWATWCRATESGPTLPSWKRFEWFDRRKHCKNFSLWWGFWIFGTIHPFVCHFGWTHSTSAIKTCSFWMGFRAAEGFRRNSYSSVVWASFGSFWSAGTADSCHQCIQHGSWWCASSEWPSCDVRGPVTHGGRVTLCCYRKGTLGSSIRPE